MRLEYNGETRWTPLTGAALETFTQQTGAMVGEGLPDVVWQPLPFYDFTALVRLPDAVGGASEWYLNNGGRFWPLDKFGVTIAALNETASIRLNRESVRAYFRFWCAFTTAPKRFVVLDVKDPDLAAEAIDETDLLLRGVVVEGHSPSGWLLSATVLLNGTVQRAYFRVSSQGQVSQLDHVALSLADVTKQRKAS